MDRSPQWLSFFVALLVAVSTTSSLAACPFCNATSPTLTEEMNTADVVVLAKLVEAGKAAGPDEPLSAIGKSTFRITETLKGADLLEGSKTLEVVHFGDAKTDVSFLITGDALPNLKWKTPIPVSKEAEEYVMALPTLPEKGPRRLAFFQEYLESDDPLLAQDTYDEFARAPYEDVRALKDQMNKQRLVEWIQDVENVAPSRRRLYFTMLGVCGGPEEIPLLEKLMRSDQRQDKSGLDALIACYLTLRGAEGLPLVEELFLKNKDAEYADTYAAIMAIRFHGQESDVIDRKRLVKSLRYMLDRPDLADMVMTDLARWEDWEVLDRLVTLFKNADEDSSWVRVPVVSYLLAAAKQQGEVGKQAQAAIDELSLIDAEAVKQAKSFAAFGALAGPRRPTPSGDAANANEDPPAEKPGSGEKDDAVQPTRSNSKAGKGEKQTSIRRASEAKTASAAKLQGSQDADTAPALPGDFVAAPARPSQDAQEARSTPEQKSTAKVEKAAEDEKIPATEDVASAVPAKQVASGAAARIPASSKRTEGVPIKNVGVMAGVFILALGLVRVLSSAVAAQADK